MPRALQTTALRVKQQLAGFTTAQKVIGVLLVVGLALGAVALGRWVTAPTYTPLFSNLAGSDASAIVDKLDADGVKYQITDGGATIMVPKDVVYAERVKLSGAGLPSSTDGGYSLLDKQGVTASQFQQQVTYQRALEGELAKTIDAIDGVSSSVVHLAIPAKDVFLDAQSKPSASVLVAMKPGSSLTDQQVQSIVHLVASSIEGMDAQDVTVVDGKGNLLSTKGSVGATGAGGASRDQVTADYESQQAGALQAVLDKILGPGRAVAKVNAQLQFDSVDTTTERVYTDKNALPLATSTTKETYSGGGSGNASGVLGTDNIAVPGGSTGSGTGKYDKTTTTTNNAESKVTEKRTAAPGSVLKQSVSVVVDSKVTGVDLTKLTTAVSSAAGIDAKRGDSLSVTSMPFDTSAATAAAAELKKAEAAEKKGALIGYATKGAKALGLLVLLLVVFLKVRKLGSAPKGSAESELVQLDLVEQRATAALPGQRQALDGAGQLPALEGGPSSPAAPQRRKEDVLALVERQPDEVAELLRGWLADRRS